MSGSEEDGHEEQDPFWEIALNYDGSDNSGNYKHGDDEGDGDSDEEDDEIFGGKAKIYRLPNSSLSLELAPLASDDGVWSPVGDHAWYSSALLTCLILQGMSAVNNEDHDGDNEKGIKVVDDLTGGIGWDQFEAGKDIRILELGSGAIGLPGISFAAALSQRPELFPSWTVSLTDNDMSLLKQLESNVRSNIAPNKINLSNTGDGVESLGKKSVNVEYLDWDIESNDASDENVKKTKRNNPDALLSADIVIGSELVYTRETGLALVKILFALLDRNPAVKIWIVQVTDRYGWKEIVIPTLESKKNIMIESIPLTYDVHEIASTMIPMGGALDRYAFGAFCISNTK
eukprot:CAMPEP_0197269730 /NCGR_PEP_ID=MMETSP1432-20130617/5981_1 /TAXON_ID=44447 /ORGANISM="Pseudo-nitzschia delicatissima, Strain UNC1205" /LENGTH=344 /DNA_ID=CAMNT_0042734935 /DNA_START=101 /DNA_END=1135 /DNA_ORIENTATION=-